MGRPAIMCARAMSNSCARGSRISWLTRHWREKWDNAPASGLSVSSLKKNIVIGWSVPSLQWCEVRSLLPLAIEPPGCKWPKGAKAESDQYGYHPFYAPARKGSCDYDPQDCQVVARARSPSSLC